MNMTPRQLRRLEERRLRKQNRKEINQENAQHSTGPRTEEGKAVSSRNAVRHGLTGTFCVLPSEDKEAFLLLLGQLFTEHDPQTTTEELLVSDMARHYWLTQRAMRLQDHIMLEDHSDEKFQKQLALYIRYQTTNQRAFHKCLADLQKLQKQRRSEEDRFVSKLEQIHARAAETQREKAAAASVNQPDGFVSQPAPGDSPIPNHKNGRSAEANQARR